MAREVGITVPVHGPIQRRCHHYFMQTYIRPRRYFGANTTERSSTTLVPTLLKVVDRALSRTDKQISARFVGKKLVCGRYNQ